MTTTETMDPKFIAGIDMLHRTGMQQFRIGHSAEDDGVPYIWHATAIYVGNVFEVAAGRDPMTALMRLCEQLIDGGTCAHCKKFAIFVHDTLELDPLDSMGCVTAYDPELKTFRRGCE